MIKWFFYSLRLSSSSSSYFPFLLILIACYFFYRSEKWNKWWNAKEKWWRDEADAVVAWGSEAVWRTGPLNNEMNFHKSLRWLGGFSLDDSVSSRRGRWRLVNVSRLGGGGGETNESLPVVDVWYGGEPEAEVTKAVAEAQRRNMFFYLLYFITN